MRAAAASALVAAGIAISSQIPTADAQVTAAAVKRDHVVVVGSRSMRPFAELLQEQLAPRGMPAPTLDLKGSSDGIKRLCAGVGPEFPDVVMTSRRIFHNEVEICHDNGVRELIEVAIGFDAVVLAMRPQDTPMALKLEHIYRAVAAELPDGDEFEPNKHTTWNQIDPSLPDTEIRLIVPHAKDSTRGVFNDIFMEGGCRYVKEIRAIFDAEDRVARCTASREDGRITEIGDPYSAKRALEQLRDAPAGTIVVIDYDEAHAAGVPLTLLPIEGVPPTPTSIALDDYHATTKHFFYFKKAHMVNPKGGGVVHGMRHMIEELSSDRAIGPSGYIVKDRLIALSHAELVRQRRAAQRLRRLDPTD